MPVIRLNRRHAARAAEQQATRNSRSACSPSPSASEHNPDDPFLPLLAADTLTVAQQAEPQQVAKTSLDFQLLFGRRGVGAGVLIWLGISGPGFLGYGTSLLWGGCPRASSKPFYAIQVRPGQQAPCANAPTS